MVAHKLYSQSQDQGAAAGFMTENTQNNTMKAIASGNGGDNQASSLAARAVNNVKHSAKNALMNSHFVKSLQTDCKILISLVQVNSYPLLSC